MKLSVNIGAADKVIRITISAIIILLFAMDMISGPLAAGLIALAAILFLTALVGFCPLYKLFGFASGKKKPA